MTRCAESSFRQGLSAFADARYLVAADLFLAAMQIESKQATQYPEMRYLSYYGLSLARARRSLSAALQACELAVHHKPRDPVLQLNLGRAYHQSGQISRALACFERGLKLAPGCDALRRELHCTDRRSRPLIGFLSRANILNRWTGKLRVMLDRRSFVQDPAI